MLLYHGSYLEILRPSVKYSRGNLDFGQGFYLAKEYEQAYNWAMRFRHRKLSCVVNVYELDLEALLNDYQVKMFDKYDEEWLHYVIENRAGLSKEKYDIITGGIANDKVFNTIELFQSGLINEEETLGRLKYEKPNWQMCIRNQEILDKKLKFLKSEVAAYGGE